MNRFCGGLMTAFRVIQLLLSLVLLASGAFVTYQMFSMSASAHQLEEVFVDLQNNSTARQDIEKNIGMDPTKDDETVVGFLATLNKLLVPVLQMLQGTPARAIVVAVVGLWSIVFITYLVIAHYSTRHPNMNRQSIRVPLEFFTLLLWISAIICAALLTMQYGLLAISGGIGVKAAISSLEAFLKQALNIMVTRSSTNGLLQSLDVVDDILKIGAVAIIALASSVVCGIISLVSFILSCCITGKRRKNEYNNHHNLADVGYMAPPMTNGYGIVDKHQVRRHVTEVVPANHAYLHHHGMGYSSA